MADPAPLQYSCMAFAHRYFIGNLPFFGTYRGHRLFLFCLAANLFYISCHIRIVWPPRFNILHHSIVEAGTNATGHWKTSNLRYLPVSRYLLYLQIYILCFVLI